jgi:hypothetical protein
MKIRVLWYRTPSFLTWSYAVYDNVDKYREEAEWVLEYNTDHKHEPISLTNEANACRGKINTLNTLSTRDY